MRLALPQVTLVAIDASRQAPAVRSRLRRRPVDAAATRGPAAVTLAQCIAPRSPGLQA